jgi:GxxExxY protein
MNVNQITETIIGCAYKVHNELHGGFLEKVYENALAHELAKAGMKVEQKKPLSVYYDGIIVGEYFIDLLVEDTVIVELKSIQRFNDAHLAQTLSYLKAINAPLGLLINFGKSVEVKRVINTPKNL